MASWKTPLRVLVAAGSVVGFFGSWALLAHAPKPVPAVARAPQVEIDRPMPDLASPPSLQPLPVLPALPNFTLPRLRTHAS